MIPPQQQLPPPCVGGESPPETQKRGDAAASCHWPLPSSAPPSLLPPSSCPPSCSGGALPPPAPDPAAACPVAALALARFSSAARREPLEESCAMKGRRVPASQGEPPPRKTDGGKEARGARCQCAACAGSFGSTLSPVARARRDRRGAGAGITAVRGNEEIERGRRLPHPTTGAHLPGPLRPCAACAGRSGRGCCERSDARHPEPLRSREKDFP